MTPTANPPSAATGCRGKIIEWNSAKNFGFVDDGQRRVFAHIRDFKDRHKHPEPGDLLTYTVGTDNQGRTCARDIRQLGYGGRVRLLHLFILTALLVGPGIAIWRLAGAETARWLWVWIGVASAVTFALYAWDKRCATRGASRIPEKVLHFWEMIGGWPGAYLAQRSLRHKSSKLSYQFSFWLIVVAHQYVAVDWQLDWRLFKQGKQAIHAITHRATTQP
jgi:uncharacterized membrane protein YsdA (DUF1294 family)/cold shock CspA family protein